MIDFTRDKMRLSDVHSISTCRIRSLNILKLAFPIKMISVRPARHYISNMICRELVGSDKLLENNIFKMIMVDQ